MQTRDSEYSNLPWYHANHDFSQFQDLYNSGKEYHGGVAYGQNLGTVSNDLMKRDICANFGKAWVLSRPQQDGSQTLVG